LFEKGRSITKINNKDKNQSINNEDAGFIKRKILNKGNIETIQPIVNALMAKGLPIERLHYADTIEAIKELQKKGATPVLFEEAYDIAVYTTQGRGFGVRYLNKVVEDLLTQSREPKSYRAAHPSKNLDGREMAEKIYENELTNGSHWIEGEE
jgi:hypothetical protein